jgi:ribonuclease G
MPVSYELLINSTPDGVRIALTKDKKLVELHNEDNASKFTVGDIILGTVKKVVPGLNAAFIDIGYEKDAFLHYLDLGPQFRTLNKFTRHALSGKNPIYDLGKFKKEPDIDKLGKIGQVLVKGHQLLVQVVKEPISTKGPRLSCELSIAGRYMVLVPFSDAISISKKITSQEERKRLTRLISSIKPPGFGLIIRTVAEKKDVAELDRDLQNLMSRWEEGLKNLPKAKPRDKVIGEMGRVSSLLRDMLNESFDAILVDDKNLTEEVRSFIHEIAPDKEKIVKRYSGKVKLFEAYGIEKQFKSLFGRTVSLPNGGYIIIEHTEALHVIDVNSGNKSADESDQESTAMKTNMEAAEEIARQLRLRDMGGIIVIDFIDMRRMENKRLVYQKMKEAMSPDRSKYTVLPLSKFGLMQITRQRVRPQVDIVTTEICLTCGGSGKVAPAILITDQIEKDLEYLVTRQNEGQIILSLHPYLFAFFTKGLISKRTRWFFKYQRWVRLVKDSSLALNDYQFSNRLGEPIDLKQ